MGHSHSFWIMEFLQSIDGLLMKKVGLYMGTQMASVYHNSIIIRQLQKDKCGIGKQTLIVGKQNYRIVIMRYTRIMVRLMTLKPIGLMLFIITIMEIK